MDNVSPFRRVFLEDELLQLKYPRTPDYITFSELINLIYVTFAVIILINWFMSSDHFDVLQSILVLSLALSLNGIITDTIKLTG